MRLKFITEDGFEVPAVTAEQMHKIDRIVMEETGPNFYQMMENAGRNLAALSMRLLGKNWEQTKIMILAGTGGNGGGGICTARHLANRNANVTLCVSNQEKLASVPLQQYKVFENTSGQTIDMIQSGGSAFDLIIDAIIGYSLRGEPEGTALKLIQWANQSPARVLSLDVPSGTNATTGQTPGESILADWTMTLALPKTGLIPQRTGELFLADIGIPAETYHKIDVDYLSPFGNKFIIPLLSP